MAEPEEREKLLTDVKDRLGALAMEDAERLGRPEMSSEINFVAAVPHLEKMLDVCKDLHTRDLSRLPIQELNKVAACARLVEKDVERIKDFSLTGVDSPGSVAESLVAEIRVHYDDVMHNAMNTLAFTATQSADYAQMQREARGVLEEMKDTRGNVLEEMKGLSEEAAKALSAVKEQAAKAGVATNAAIFESEASRHETSSNNWFRVTCGFGVLTIVAAFGAVYGSIAYAPPTTGAAIQYVVAKLFALSTLTFAMVWSARNYKAERHNVTVNKHRANALNTFRAFVEGTHDENVKDAILVHAAQAAFTGRPTGFDAPDGDSVTISPIVDIVGRGVRAAT